MLDVFIIQSSSGGKDIQRLTDSFTKKEDDDDISFDIITHEVQRISQINSIVKEGEWFFVLFDNEYIDRSLKHSLITFMAHAEYDVYVVMKMPQTRGAPATEAPRLFKSSLVMSQNSLIPLNSDDLKSERILNGWVMDDRSFL